MSNINKKDVKVFTDAFTKIVEEYGFKLEVDLNLHNYYHYISPEFGEYKCRCDAESGVYSIFGRFDDNVKAKDILKEFTGNEYSGKCNFHEFDSSKILNDFEMFVKYLTFTES